MKRWCRRETRRQARAWFERSALVAKFELPGCAAPGARTAGSRYAPARRPARSRRPPLFRLQADFQPTSDQPEAIRQLIDGLQRGDRRGSRDGASEAAVIRARRVEPAASQPAASAPTPAADLGARCARGELRRRDTPRHEPGWPASKRRAAHDRAPGTRDGSGLRSCSRLLSQARQSFVELVDDAPDGTGPRGPRRPLRG